MQTRSEKRPKRILYAAGPGNVLESYRSWRTHEDHESEVSTTYSGQFFDFCRDFQAMARVVSSHRDRAVLREGLFHIEHRPKPLRRFARGPMYRVMQVLNGLGIVATAIRMRADSVVVHNDTTYPVVLFPLAVLGKRVVCVLHNTLWSAAVERPRGHGSTTGWLWRRFRVGVVCISPECARQVRAVAGRCRGPVVQMFPQYPRGLFDAVPAPSPEAERPFVVMFASRVERSKGVFDVLEAASLLEAERPGCFRWEVCGAGSDLGEVREAVQARGLGGIVTVHGALERDEMLEAYGRSHAVIVPTRTDFCEGLCKVAVEAVLAGRPVVTSRAVPALEILGDAAIEAEPDDAPSYARALAQLRDDAARYAQACAACRGAQARFFDRSYGFAAALRAALETGPTKSLRDLRIPESELTHPRADAETRASSQ